MKRTETNSPPQIKSEPNEILQEQSDLKIIKDEPNTGNQTENINEGELLKTFILFTPQSDIISSLMTDLTARPDNLSHVSYILKELKGARELELLTNKINCHIEFIGSLSDDTTQFQIAHQKLYYLTMNLRNLFPYIALNPCLCEKWSLALKNSISNFRWDIISMIYKNNAGGPYLENKILNEPREKGTMDGIKDI